MSHLGDHFRARRMDRKLSTGELARMVGYSNLSRGSNRIQKFESDGKIALDLLARLTSVLEISPEEVRRLAAADYRAWLDWANEPIRPHVVLKHMACVYQRIELPDDALGPTAAEVFAARLAAEKKRIVCLVLSRRLSIGFDATGKEYQRLEATLDLPCEPYTVIGGRRVQFDFDGDELLRPIDEPSR